MGIAGVGRVVLRLILRLPQEVRSFRACAQWRIASSSKRTWLASDHVGSA